MGHGAAPTHNVKVGRGHSLGALGWNCLTYSTTAMHGHTAHAALRPFKLRFTCDVVVCWCTITMGWVGMECVHMGMGWGEWESQVEHWK